MLVLVIVAASLLAALAGAFGGAWLAGRRLESSLAESVQPLERSFALYAEGVDRVTQLGYAIEQEFKALVHAAACQGIVLERKT